MSKVTIWIATAAVATLAFTGCSERDTSTLPPAPPNDAADVFIDAFGAGTDFQAFAGSNVAALEIDTSVRHAGTASLKVTVPNPGDPFGEWSGGAFTTSLARDLSGYNALTFWAKSSVPTTLNVAGIANDNTGTSKYSAEVVNIPLTTTWTKYTIPIPLPEKLSSEKGLFYFAESPEGGQGHVLWFDDIIFESLATVADPRPALAVPSVDALTGATFPIPGTRTTFRVDGADLVVEHQPGYFTFASSDETVAMITDGEIHVIGEGTATVTAWLGTIPASGEITVNSVGTGAVFIDNFTEGIDFQAFAGSNLGALATDTVERHAGAASLRVTVPSPGDPAGAWAGGAVTTSNARDLSGYNALTFWAKSSVPTTLDVAGLGNDNTGTSRYDAEWRNIPLTTTWTKYTIPIPLPEKLTSEQGLFFFAEGPEGASGHVVWFDDITFETVTTIADPRPAMRTETVNAFVGTTLAIAGTQTTFRVDGTDQLIAHRPGYFSFLSSNGAVATIGDDAIQVVGAGTAEITGSLGGTPVSGQVTVNAIAPPAAAAPTPGYPTGNVISLFSDAYDNVTVDTWSAGWDRADVADLEIAGNKTKAYTNLVYAGIEFTSATIDAATMTHLRIDVWTPGGTVFRVKLVDFGADGVYGGGNDSEHELTFTATSTPAFVPGNWSSLDIPLAEFSRLAGTTHLAQLIISGDPGTAFVDNILFHK